MNNTIFLVIVAGVVIAMLVMMVKYAKFIHHYPQETEKNRLDKPENTPSQKHESGSEE